MTKFCIFCGNPPVTKNKEHIIPRWLIELTGAPSRPINLLLFGDPRKPPIEMSFSSFYFPACLACNEDFGRIEGKTKPVILKMLNRDAVSRTEITLFLDWMDKIRIGLWLGIIYLGNNFFNVKPQFHVAKRIGGKDRMVVIYKSDQKMSGIGFIGVNFPVFIHGPSCFTLIINDLAFFNVSSEFLISRRLGFPYPSISTVRGYGQVECELQPGMERAMCPLVNFSYSKLGVEVFQPIFNDKLSTTDEKDDRKKYYDTDYVRDWSLSHESGIGTPLIQKTKTLTKGPEFPSKIWYPEYCIPFNELSEMCLSQTVKVQCKLIEESPFGSDPRFQKMARTISNANLKLLAAIEKTSIKKCMSNIDQ